MEFSKSERSCVIVERSRREYQEAFILFNDDLLDVFPNNKNLFLQRIIAYQLPNVSLFRILKKNINLDSIDKEDELYLKFNLCFLKEYELYMNENFLKYDYFTFKEICNNESLNLFEENIEMIWKWVKILSLLIKQINTLNIHN